MSKGGRVKRSGWKHPVRPKRNRRRLVLTRRRQSAYFRLMRRLLTEKELDRETRT